MNLLSKRLGNNMRRKREALSVFVVMLVGLVCVGSARAQDGSRYAYVPNADGISIYTVDVKTGQLRSYGCEFPGSGLGAATVDPSTRFVYALGSNSISVFKINASSGGLTAVIGSP